MKRLDFMNVVYVVLKRCMDVVTDVVTDDVDVGAGRLICRLA